MVNEHFKPAYDYSALRGKIKEVFGTEGKFADALGKSQNFLSSVWKNESYFKQTDIDKSAELLTIEPCDIGRYFFKQKVHEMRM